MDSPHLLERIYPTDPPGRRAFQIVLLFLLASAIVGFALSR